jgi:hypothetical protein
VTAIAERGRSQRSQESPAHDVGAPEAASGRDLEQTLVGLLQETSGRLEAQLEEVAGRRGAELLGEHAGKVPRAHRRLVGERVDR